jgi:hypothetical protein
MTWQLIAVGVIVAVAVLYLARQTWRAWNPKKGGCGGSCGCAGKPAPVADRPEQASALIPSEQLTLRRRPGS